MADANAMKDPGQQNGSRWKHDSMGVEGSLQRFHLLDPSYSTSLFYRETSLFFQVRALFTFPSPFMDVVELIEEHHNLSLDAPNPSPGSFDPPLMPPPLPSTHLPVDRI